MSFSASELEPISQTDPLSNTTWGGEAAAGTGEESGGPLSYAALLITEAQNHIRTMTAEAAASDLLEPFAADCNRLAARIRELRARAKETRQKITAASEMEKVLSDRQAAVRGEWCKLVQQVCERPETAGFAGNTELNAFTELTLRALHELDTRAERLRANHERECAELTEVHGRLVANLVALKATVREGLAEEEGAGAAAATAEGANACIICGENPVDRVFVECGHTACGACCAASDRGAVRLHQTSTMECFFCRRRGRVIRLFLQNA